MKQGLLACTAAYFMWGLFPVYWKWLHEVPSAQVMAHRVVWCTLFVLGWLLAREGFGWITQLNRRLLKMLCASSLLIGFNWWLYIWAVNAGHVVESSLGYFMNPLVSVLFGVLVLRERLNTAQWVSVALAAAGVLWLTLQAGRLPWIALSLAFSFGSYGLLRKVAVVPSVQGLAVESSLLFLPALTFLIWSETQGLGAFGHSAAGTEALLVASGLITAVPLALFAYGARRIPLSMVGILQYLAPSLQLACGVFLFHEPFSSVQAVGFACIWAGLGVYAADSLWRSRRAG